MPHALDIILDELFARLKASPDEAAFATLVNDFSRPEFLESLVRPHREKQARHDHRRDVIAGIYRGALQRLLAKAQIATLHNLSKVARSARDATSAQITNARPAAADLRLSPLDARPSTLDWLFDLDEFSDDFAAVMRAAGEEAYIESSKGALADLLGEGELEKWQVTRSGLIQKFVNARSNALKDAPEEIYRGIQDELREGALAGETMPELAARVQKAFATVGERRADLIARTETASAYSTAALDSMRAAGFTHKRWVISNDERVRTSHRECAAQGAIPIDEVFKNGLMNPGDPFGGPEEVINCRCYLEAAKA